MATNNTPVNTPSTAPKQPVQLAQAPSAPVLTPATPPASPNAGRPPAKISIPKSAIKELRVVDTDFVITTIDGRKVFVRDGAVRALFDPEFSMEFQDGVKVSGREVMQSIGQLQVGNVGAVTPLTPEAAAASNVETIASESVAQSAKSAGAAADVSAAGLIPPAILGPAGGKLAAAYLPWAAAAAPLAGAAISGGGSGSGASLSIIPSPVLNDLNINGFTNILNGGSMGSSVSFSGLATAGSTVDVSFNGITKSVVASDSGVFTATYSSSELPQNNGPYKVTAQVVNGSNYSDPASMNIMVDTSAAAPTITDISSGYNATSGLADVVSKIEKNAGVTFSGTAEAGATVTGTWANVSKTALANSAGKWSITFASNDVPSDGSSTVAFSQKDIYGNSSSNTSLDMVVKSTLNAPTIIVDGSAAGSFGDFDDYINNSERTEGINITGDAKAAGVNVLVQLKNAAGTVLVSKTVTSSSVAAANGSYPYVAAFDASSIPNQTDSAGANYTIRVELTDLQSGNTAVSEKQVTIDTFAKTVVINNVGEVVGTTDTVYLSDLSSLSTYSVTGTAEAGSNIQVTWGTQVGTVTQTGDGTWTAVFNAAQYPAVGNSTLTVATTDAAGNTRSAAKTVNVLQAAPADTVILSTGSGSAAVYGALADGRITSRDTGSTLQIRGTAAVDTTDLVLYWASDSAYTQNLLTQSAGVVKAISADGKSLNWTFNVNKTAIPNANQIVNGAETFLKVVATTSAGVQKVGEIQKLVVDMGTNVPQAVSIGTLLNGAYTFNSQHLANGVTLIANGGETQGTGSGSSSMTLRWGSLSLPMQKYDTTGERFSVNLTADQVNLVQNTSNLTLTTTDSSGNTASRTLAVAFDLVAPTVTLTAAKIASGANVPGSSTNASSSSTFYLNKALIGDTSTDAQNSLTLSGQKEAGQNVTVSLYAEGSTIFLLTSQHTAAGTSWETTFTKENFNSIVGGLADGNYRLEIVSTDAAGNSLTINRTLVVDRVASVTIDKVAGDDDINKADAENLFFTGTIGEEGVQSLQVTWSNGTVQKVYTATVSVVNGQSVWTTEKIPAADILLMAPSGFANTTVVATYTDLAGNVVSNAAAPKAVVLNTSDINFNLNSITGDNKISLTEINNNQVILSGSSNKNGATVSFTWVDADGQAIPGLSPISPVLTSASNGSWTSSSALNANQLPGTGSRKLKINLTDTSGNTFDRTFDVLIGKSVPVVNITTNSLAGDDKINLAEQNAGVTISGTVDSSLFTTTGADGSKVEVTLGGDTDATRVTKTATLTPIANSTVLNWSVTFRRAASDFPADVSNATLSVVATDAAGNATTSLRSGILIDRTAPAATIYTGTDIEHAATKAALSTNGANKVSKDEAALPLVFNGVTEKSSDVSWTLLPTTGGGTGISGTTIATSESGVFTFSVDTSTLANGSYTLRAQATDVAGNVGTLSSGYTFVVGNTKPVLSIPTKITDDSKINITESDNGVTISGSVTSSLFTTTGNDGSKVTVKLGNIEKTATVTAGTGTNVYNWSVLFKGASDFPTNFTNTTLTVDATDAAGNLERSALNGIVIDRTAPTPTLNTGNNIADATTREALSDGSVTASEATNLKFDGTTEAGSGGSISWELWKGDVKSLSGSSSPSSLGAYTFTVNLNGLDNGTYTLKVAATDAAGNTGKVLNDYSFLLSNTKPSLSLPTTVATDKKINNKETVDGVEISGTVTSSLFAATGTDTSSVSVKLGSVEKTATVSETDTPGIFTWSATFKGEDDFPSDNTNASLVVVATDRAGNSTTNTMSGILIDTVLPNTTFNINTSDTAINKIADASTRAVFYDGYINLTESTQTLKIDGTTETNSTVYWVIDDIQNPLTPIQTLAGNATVQSGTAYSISLPSVSSLVNGRYSLSVYAIDSAGNRKDATNTLGFQVDKSTPNLSVTSISKTLNANDITNRPVFSGTGEVGAKVVVTWGDWSNTAVTVGADGKWSITGPNSLPTSFEAGNNVKTTYSVVATDIAGNSTSSGSLDLYIDTVAPSVSFASKTPVLVDDTGVYVVGQLKDDDTFTDNRTNKLRPKFSVDVTGLNGFVAADQLQLMHGNIVMGFYTIKSSDLDANGAFSVNTVEITPNVDLTPGTSYDFGVRVGDTAGNTPGAASLSLLTGVIVDRSANTSLIAATLSMASSEYDTGNSASDNKTAVSRPPIVLTGLAGKAFSIGDHIQIINTSNSNSVLADYKVQEADLVNGLWKTNSNTLTLPLSSALNNSVHVLKVQVVDAAGNTSVGNNSLTLDVNSSNWDLRSSQMAIGLNGSTGQSDAANDNVLGNGSAAGETLTLAHLGLNSGLSNGVLKFTSLEKITVFNDGVQVLANGSDISLADVSAGRVVLKYSDTASNIANMGVTATAAFTLRDTYQNPISGSINFQLAAGAAGAVIYGDESGDGSSARWINATNNPANWAARSGGTGGGGSDQLLGTAVDDMIFGDGSGGGIGAFSSNINPDQTIYNGVLIPVRPGAGGGGADTLSGGDGSDVLFGDGFAGTTLEGQTQGQSVASVRADGTLSTSWNVWTPTAGGYGGGGGGGGLRMSDTSFYFGAAGGVGASQGAISSTSRAATANTYRTSLGAESQYTESATTPNAGTPPPTVTPGPGQGVISTAETVLFANFDTARTVGGGAYVAEIDGLAGSNRAVGTSVNGAFDNTTVSVALLVNDAKAAFLDGPGGDNSENRMFTQVMGAGADVIRGGSGHDYIMGGYGNDTIAGGSGNDIMYGRGGGNSSTSTLPDSDTFVWQRGDAQGNPQGALDIIRDFSASTSTSLSNSLVSAVHNGDDKLNIAELLTGFINNQSQLSQWVTIQNGIDLSAQTGALASLRPASGFDVSAGKMGALITIDVDGPGSGTATQYIFLNGVTFTTTDVDQLKTAGVIIVA